MTNLQCRDSHPNVPAIPARTLLGSNRHDELYENPFMSTGVFIGHKPDGCHLNVTLMEY